MRGERVDNLKNLSWDQIKNGLVASYQNAKNIVTADVPAFEIDKAFDNYITSVQTDKGIGGMAFDNALGMVVGYAGGKLVGWSAKTGWKILTPNVAQQAEQFLQSRLRATAVEARKAVVPNNKAQYVYDARAGRYRETATGQFAAARNLPWPDNAGFASSAKQTVQPGTIVDRYGSQTGRFLGEPGATVSQRGMAQGSDAMPYTQYRVVKPFDAQVGPAATVPAFGASGGATQYLPSRTVEQLVQDGFLEVIK